MAGLSDIHTRKAAPLLVFHGMPVTELSPSHNTTPNFVAPRRKTYLRVCLARIEPTKVGTPRRARTSLCVCDRGREKARTQNSQGADAGRKGAAALRSRKMLLNMSLPSGPHAYLKYQHLKGFRRIFSRFEKPDVMFLAFIHFTLIVESLR